MNTRTRKTDIEQGINKLKVSALKIVRNQLRDKDKKIRLEAATKVLYLDSVFRNNAKVGMVELPAGDV
jgi:hypothetical protein